MNRSSFVIRDEKLPLLATAIHSGHEMPPELLQISGIDAAERLREEDPHTDVFASEFANHIIAHGSRFSIDLNRSRSKTVYLTPDDCWGLPARTVDIPPAVLSALYSDYDQWYAHLNFVVQRLLQHNPFLIVLDIHSFNHRRGGPAAPPDPQIDNPDIIIGRSNLPESRYPAAAALCDLLSAGKIGESALDCRMDVKFTGGYMSRYLNAKYPERLMCLAIEFKKTFMDEWSGVLDKPAFDALRAHFVQCVRQWMKDIG